MFGTFEYNKIPVMKPFIVFLFPANDKTSKNCSRSVHVIKISRNSIKKFTCLGNLVLTVRPLVEQPALKDSREALLTLREP